MIRIFLVILTLVAATPAVAAPQMTESLIHYPVSGDNLGELRREMEQNGPNGFWGYTRWWIEWSKRCEVTLTTTITMPRLEQPERLSARDLVIWQRMEAALYAHERLHAAHGIAAAREIHQAGCRNARAIINKWARQDRILDRTTRHGRTQGVRLD